MVATARPHSAAVPPVRAADGRRQLQSLAHEHGFEPLEVEGAVPAELSGTLFRNGPALFERFGQRYKHLFDGDGAVSGVRFAGGRVTGGIRVVQSRALDEERRAGRALYGGYGTVQPGLMNRLRGKMKNAANTSVLVWSDRLLALWEGGRPTELSPDDLFTLGETTLDGAIVGSFSAHPTPVASRGAIYNFGVRYGRHTLLDLYELRPGGRIRRMATLPLPGPTMIHDFAATDRHLVFLAPPLRMRVARALLGLASFADSLAWRPELGTEVIIVPIDDPTRPTRFTIDPCYVWHYANAFERDDQIVVDLVRYDDFASNDALADLVEGEPGGDTIDGTFHRLVLDLRRKTAAAEQRWPRACEFPRIAPRAGGAAYRHTYVAANAPGRDGLGLHTVIAKLDVERGTATEYPLPDGQYVSEPVFAPRPGGDGEDDGWLLAYAYDPAAHRTSALILDARDVERGPLARASFGHHIPPTFHGVWSPT